MSGILRFLFFFFVIGACKIYAQRSHYGHAGYHGGGHGTHGWHDHYTLFYGPSWGYNTKGKNVYGRPTIIYSGYFGPHLNPSYPIYNYRGDPSIYTDFVYPSYPYRGTYYINNFQYPSKK